MKTIELLSNHLFTRLLSETVATAGSDNIIMELCKWSGKVIGRSVKIIQEAE